jgi:hypothetical protein
MHVYGFPLLCCCVQQPVATQHARKSDRLRQIITPGRERAREREREREKERKRERERERRAMLHVVDE